MILNKSKVKQGQQCIKALYLGVHKRYLAKYSKDSQKAFSVGNEIGLLARKKYPQGILISEFKNQEKLNSTTKALSKNLPIFEATFVGNKVLAQIDILRPREDKFWDVIEVKSGTSIKDEYLEDIAIQYYVLKTINFPIKNYFIWIVDKTSSEESTLFKEVNVTESLEVFLEKYPKLIENFLNILKKKQEPSVDIGSHCTFPYECPFKSYCWKKIPSKKTIFQIPNFSQKWQAYKEKIISIDDPKLEKYNLNPKLIKAIKEDTLWVDKEFFKNNLKNWTFPLSVLDLETYQKPLYDFSNTKPYQQIPFQASVSMLEKKDDKIKTLQYLHSTNTDPRLKLCEFIVSSIPASGTVLAYNKKFEIKVLEELSLLFPIHEKTLSSIINRMEDPWELLKAGLYHPEFSGSYSLKKVAPALLGDQRSYKHLDIKDGLEAQESYFKLLTLPEGVEKEDLKNKMISYCNADTENLILIYLFLIQF